MDELGNSITIYGGVEPRISVSISKGQSAAAAALKFLKTAKKGGI